jgi:hypothetical protein
MVFGLSSLLRLRLLPHVPNRHQRIVSDRGASHIVYLSGRFGSLAMNHSTSTPRNKLDGRFKRGYYIYS